MFALSRLFPFGRPTFPGFPDPAGFGTFPALEIRFRLRLGLNIRAVITETVIQAVPDDQRNGDEPHHISPFPRRNDQEIIGHDRNGNQNVI